MVIGRRHLHLYGRLLELFLLTGRSSVLSVPTAPGPGLRVVACKAARPHVDPTGWPRPPSRPLTLHLQPTPLLSLHLLQADARHASRPDLNRRVGPSASCSRSAPALALGFACRGGNRRPGRQAPPPLTHMICKRKRMC
jgi:hypothetical protein